MERAFDADRMSRLKDRGDGLAVFPDDLIDLELVDHHRFTAGAVSVRYQIVGAMSS